MGGGEKMSSRKGLSILLFYYIYSLTSNTTQHKQLWKLGLNNKPNLSMNEWLWLGGHEKSRVGKKERRGEVE